MPVGNINYGYKTDLHIDVREVQQANTPRPST